MARYDSPAIALPRAIDALQAGNLSRANVLAWVCIEQEPAHADAYNLLGVIACQLEIFGQAIHFFDRALQHNPDHAAAQANRRRAQDDLSRRAADAGPNSAGRRFHVIQSWGTGFWSDVLHVVGQLLVADMAHRQPIVNWGTHSNFNSHPPKDCFVDFFEPVSDTAVNRLVEADLKRFPPYWTNEEILGGYRRQRSEKERGFSGIYFLSREEPVTIANHFSDIASLRQWIPPDHPWAGLSAIDTIRRCMEKWIRPRPELLAQARAFCRNELQGRPFIAIHVRGTDKVVEAPSTDLHHAALLKRADELAAANATAPIFAMTDDESLVGMIRERYGERVVMMDVIRSRTAMGIHWRQQGFNRRTTGQEILVESLVAAQAALFVGYGTSTVPCMIECLKDWPAGTCQVLGTRVTELLNEYIYS